METSEQKLIILRGNSGSGKSSVARVLRERMGYGTAIVEQDYIRRTLLRERNGLNQPNIELIRINVEFALSHGYDVILEGILMKAHYSEMLQKLIEAHKGKTFAYYFDVTLEETFKRHKTKPNSHDFGEEELRSWYIEKDLLNIVEERIIPETSSLDDTVTKILNDAIS